MYGRHLDAVAQAHAGHLPKAELGFFGVVV